jgi:hypothetical protein
VRIDVMELNEGSLVATSPALAHESAGPPVTPPHHTSHLGRDVSPARSRTATGLRPLRRREFLPREVFEQHRQRPIDDLAEVPAGHGVSEEVLGLS